MTMHLIDAGPTQLLRAAGMLEARGDIQQAVDLTVRAQRLTAAWNPHMAKRMEADINRLRGLL